MRITKKKLKRIIKEEYRKMISEGLKDIDVRKGMAFFPKEGDGFDAKKNVLWVDYKSPQDRDGEEVLLYYVVNIDQLDIDTDGKVQGLRDYKSKLGSGKGFFGFNIDIWKKAANKMSGEGFYMSAADAKKMGMSENGIKNLFRKSAKNESVSRYRLKNLIREEFSKIRRQQRLSESRRRRLRESMGSRFNSYVDAAAGKRLMLRQHGSHAGDGLGFFSDGRLLFAMYDLEDDMGVVSNEALDAIMDSAISAMISGEDYFEYLQGYKHPKLKMI